jgi:hypothetical protein
MKNCSDVQFTFYNWAVDNFDEINIVVDPNNGDDTYHNVMGLMESNDKVRVLVHEFDDFSSQKQRAYDMCTKPYALLMDSDEILVDIPDDAIAKFMDRAGADVGAFSRINFQIDDEHMKYGDNDYQYRLVKRGSDVKMNGAPVDERLRIGMNNKPILLPWEILHYGHIRPVRHLLLKGEDRLRFAKDDACDGPMLEKHGESWFVDRNVEWDALALPAPIHATTQSKKYWRGGDGNEAIC